MNPSGTGGRIVNLRGLTVLVACCAVVVAGAWWLRGGAGATPDDGGASGAGSGVVQQYPEQERQTPEPFTATLLDGNTFDSTSLTGSVAVYNVWGSWCGPCRAEAPTLARVSREYRDAVTFTGINVRDNDDAARAFEDAFEIPYPSITTADSGTALLAFGGALASSAVPSTVVLDEDGAVAARVVGPVSYRTLVRLVEDAGARARDPQGRADAK